MWRDILIIVAFVLAGLTYFGLTPRRVSSYAKTVKVEVTKRRLYQKVFLFLMIAPTLVYISMVIWRFENFILANILISIAILTWAWCTILSDVWGLSERGEKVVDVIVYSVMLPLLVAGTILSDMPLWQKVAYPIGGACAGYGIAALQSYIRRKSESRRYSQEEDK